ncbi:MAG TPA: hypothetical protein V6D17_09640 [Candidatus Obscuribacterales bacterium]
MRTNTNTKAALLSSAQSKTRTGSDDDPVLVIIDMQPDEFPASSDEKTIAGVMREITNAKANLWGIVIVEFDPHETGKTDPRLMRLIEGYANLAVVAKSEDDGSAEIFEAIIEHGFWPENLRICGCNSDACVLRTVEGYAKRVPSSHIQVVKSACNCLTGPTNDVWTEKFPSIANVEVLP